MGTMNCTVCGVVTNRNSSTQKYCPECSNAVALRRANERGRRWRAANKEWQREYWREWAAMHPEKQRAYRAKDKANRRAARDFFTALAMAGAVMETTRQEAV